MIYVNGRGEVRRQGGKVVGDAPASQATEIPEGNGISGAAPPTIKPDVSDGFRVHPWPIRRQVGKQVRNGKRKGGSMSESPSFFPRSFRPCALPAVVRECPVGLGHAVGVVLLLDRVALTLGGENQLRRQPLRHALLGAGPRELDDPAHG